jgi:Rrf2 family protein
MRIGEGVEWALHCSTMLAILPPDRALSGMRLAEFHGVPAPYLAKSMQALVRAGVAESVPGRRGGYRLARSIGEITLLDIVLAVEGDEQAFRCTEIRKRGPARVSNRSYTGVCSIAAAMWRAEEAWRAELRATTLADLLGHLAVTIPTEALGKAAAWLEEALQ